MENEITVAQFRGLGTRGESLQYFKESVALGKISQIDK